MSNLCALLLTGIVATAFMLLSPLSAMAADPTAFASMSGSCPATGSKNAWTGPTQTASHDDVLVRFTLTSPTTTGQFETGSFHDWANFYPGDQLWVEQGQVAAGTAPSGSIS